MRETFKKILTMTLAMLMILSLFSACGNGGADNQPETTVAAEPTQPGEEGKVL